MLHLRWCKTAFGIIVEQVWRLPGGRRVEESEGMPRWLVDARSLARGPLYARVAHSEAAMVNHCA